MDDKTRLFELAKANGVDVHHFAGIAKIQEALIDAGVEFDLVDTDTDRAPAPDEPEVHAEAEAEAAPETPEQMEARIRAAILAEAAPVGDPVEITPAQATAPAGKVKCVVMTRFQIQKRDLGIPDESGVSVKVHKGDKIDLEAGLAASLEARGQVTVV